MSTYLDCEICKFKISTLVKLNRSKKKKQINLNKQDKIREDSQMGTVKKKRPMGPELTIVIGSYHTSYYASYLI